MPLDGSGAPPIGVKGLKVPPINCVLGADVGAGAGAGAAGGLGAHSGSRKNLFRPTSSYSISAASRTSTAAGRAEDTMAGRGMMEEEAILAAFSSHLSCFFETVLSAAPADALASVFSPLCLLVPKLLVRCAMTMAVASSAAATQQRQQLLQRASITKHQLDQLQSMAGSAYVLSHLTDKQQKAFLLRIVVIIQQNMALHIQALPFPPETKRSLLDKLTEGFEHCRRFITLFGMPGNELKVRKRAAPDSCYSLLIAVGIHIIRLLVCLLLLGILREESTRVWERGIAGAVAEGDRNVRSA